MHVHDSVLEAMSPAAAAEFLLAGYETGELNANEVACHAANLDLELEISLTPRKAKRK